MRDYASAQNEQAVVWSADISGQQIGYVLEDKQLQVFAENSCADRNSPQGPLGPRTYLLTYFRQDVVTRLRAASASASPVADPTADFAWEDLLALLAAHAAAIRPAGAAAAGLPRYGLCITTDASCGRLGDVLAAIAASAVQHNGTQQGYAFDVLSAAYTAVPLVNGTGWRYALETLRSLLAYNAPNNTDGNDQRCHLISPHFLSGECMVTLDWDFVFLSLSESSVLAMPGALGVAPLPGSRRVMDRTAPIVDGSWPLVSCTQSLCAPSVNHDLLYLTSEGQRPVVLQAARDAKGTCAAGDGLRIEAAAAMVATASVYDRPPANRAPFGVISAYNVYMSYQRFAVANLGQEASLIQLAISSRVASERQLRQDALDRMRKAVASAGANGTWDGSTWAATPWWSVLGAPGVFDAPVALYTAKGLDATAAQMYLRAVLHAIHSPNQAPDIQSPAMLNWYKWGLSHTALLLSASEPSTTTIGAAALVRVWDLVSLAYTPALVRSTYMTSIGAKKAWAPAEVVPSGKAQALSTGAIVGLAVGVAGALACVVLLAMLLLHRRSRHRDLLGRVVAPRAGPDTTLLITDIVASTTLWEQLPTEVMDEALRVHHATIRSELSAADGYESATEGDSFICAFATSAQAMAFATSCQMALLCAAWPAELLAHPDGAPALVDPRSGADVVKMAALPDGRHERLSGASSNTLLRRLQTASHAFRSSFSSRSRIAATAAGALSAGSATAGGGGGGGSRIESRGSGASVQEEARDGTWYSRTVSGPRPHISASTQLPKSAPQPWQAMHKPVVAVAAVAAAACVDPGALGESTRPAGASGELSTTHEVTAHGLVGNTESTLPSSVAGAVHSTRHLFMLAAGADKAGVLGHAPPPVGLGAHGLLGWDMSDADPSVAGSHTQQQGPLHGQVPRPFSLRASMLSGLSEAAASPAPSAPVNTAGMESWWNWVGTWGKALGSAFPLVAPDDAPASLRSSSALKSHTLVLSGGRLGIVAYRGLHVRMGMHSGLDDPQHVQFNSVGSSWKYYGNFAETARCVSSAAPGGLIVMSGAAFACLRNRRMQHAAPAAHDAVIVYGGRHVLAAQRAPAAATTFSTQVQLTVDVQPATPAHGGGMGDVVSGGSLTEGLPLFMAVPSPLVCRLALSPPLHSIAQRSLGSLAAPVHCITVAFMNVVGASTLLADLPGPAARALDAFGALVTKQLGEAGGYLVEGGDGLVLAAFAEPRAAVEWALDCVDGCKHMEYADEELLEHWLCEEELTVGVAGGSVTEPEPLAYMRAPESPVAQQLAPSRAPSMARLGALATTRRVQERGLRIKVGLDVGLASHALVQASGRLSYKGRVMNRAARVAGKAAAGQVLCTAAVFSGCLARESDGGGMDGPPHGEITGISLGTCVLKGVTAPVELIQVGRA